MDTHTGEVLAYVGNVPDPFMRHQNAVDMIRAERSSGSLLKPLLYASAFQTGSLLPQMLVQDIPTNIRGYQPENFTRDYLGMVPVDEALTRSLNVPAVLILKNYGIERFRQVLLEAGLSTIRFSAEHYGLPLILGGAEIRLWDICGVYASMGRILSEAYSLNHQYNPTSLHGPISQVHLPEEVIWKSESQATLWDYGSLWITLSSMRNLTRPGEDGAWETFSSQKPIAWKTGTSFGFRDAWAVGVTPDYTVGVWVGNADGEGRPGLIGARTAAPIMFDIFRNLPGNAWWTPPYDELYPVQTCSESGYLAGPDCPGIDSELVPEAGRRASVCPFHQRIYTDIAGSYRYHKHCAPIELIEHSIFVLPPACATYYKKHHPEYRSIAPLNPACLQSGTNISDIELIYPAGNSKIYIPRELNGVSSRAVFQAAHRSSTAAVYWYLDDAFLGTTMEFHTMEVSTKPGKHQIIIVDETGGRVSRQFEIVGG
jgi:penicillin-binding protein 1C